MMVNNLSVSLIHIQSLISVAIFCYGIMIITVPNIERFPTILSKFEGFQD